jgi:hypothetical protein
LCGPVHPNLHCELPAALGSHPCFKSRRSHTTLLSLAAPSLSSSHHVLLLLLLPKTDLDQPISPLGHKTIIPSNSWLMQQQHAAEEGSKTLLAAAANAAFIRHTPHWPKKKKKKELSTPDSIGVTAPDSQHWLARLTSLGNCHRDKI